MVGKEQIAKFLEGRNPKKYIVNIEVPYSQNKASLIINDPIKGKYIGTEKFNTFLWFKEDVTKMLYGGNRTEIKKQCDRFKITITKLKTNNGKKIVTRMENGYKYMAKCNGSYSQLLNFFKVGGVEVYGEKTKRLFMALSPVEQFMIASGKRLFKGMDDYSDVYRMQFDLETTGLHAKGIFLNREEIEEVKGWMNDPEYTEDLTLKYEFNDYGEPVRHKDDEIFQIGLKDNRGYKHIIEIKGKTKTERNYYEALAIKEFFDILDEKKPDIIVGYNSEFFDWTFFELRCEILKISIEALAKTLDKSGYHKFKRVDKRIKLGGEIENYRQTTMWGINIVDGSHAVRRAKAINSNIKAWGLKYITKYSKLNKKNRVYVEGNKIYKTWADEETNYAFNDENGDYYKITEKRPLEEGYRVSKGAEIVRQYLHDDLWETEQVDGVYNQASFLLAKIIPTSYMRSTTMGTAGIWKLIMAAWSYENRIAVPDYMPQQTFTGGLSRLLEVGFAKDVAKLDFAALYPNIEITHDIFPDVDITGAMAGLLLYIADTRDEYKGLMNFSKGMVDKLEDTLKDNGDIMTDDQRSVLETELEKHKALASMYDKKQLPIKILGNSFFGSLGAPNIFAWGDTNCAEETTCRGRQYLRLMVDFFVKKGFRPLVGDTDGFNFAIPEDIGKFKYVPKGTHRFTEKTVGQEVEGLQAVVDEYNELYMIGRMGLDIDDICTTTINFSRKNYANAIKGKVKLVGNTIKSSKMPIYIEEFLGEAIKFLLDGDGYSFIELYNETVEKIYNFQIPLVKIASKANVKQTVKQYEADMKTKTKAGNFKAKKAYMELLMKEGMQANLGTTVYYVNTGTVKSHGDCKVVTDKETGKRTVQLQCKLISTEQIEENPELTTDEYNVPKYLDALNKKVKTLMVCFDDDIRDKIMIHMVKNKETKEMELTELHAFTRKQCELTSGSPHEDGDQDTLEELMLMEDKEIEFWMRVHKEPNNLDDLNMDWPQIQLDYHERKRIEKIESMAFEKSQIDKVIKSLEVDELEIIRNTNILPKTLSSFVSLSVQNDDDGAPMIFLISNRWENKLADINELFKYEAWAEQRVEFYETVKYKKNKTFEFWLEDMWKKSMDDEEYPKANMIKFELKKLGIHVGPEEEVEVGPVKL